MSKKKHELEKLCINVNKVYDWVTRQVEKDINFIGDKGWKKLGFDDVTPCPDLEDDFIVKVIFEDVECEEVGKRKDIFVEEFDTLMQIVKIKVQGNFRIVFFKEDDKKFEPIVSDLIPFCIFEKFVLCAPEGTKIKCHVYDSFGFGGICCNGDDFQELAVTLVLCLSVQAEAKVKVQIEGKICQPREDIILPIPIRECPEIEFPPQCPNVFPPC